MGRTQCSSCWGPGSIPGQGTKIPQAMQLGKRKKKATLDRKRMASPAPKGLMEKQRKRQVPRESTLGKASPLAL